MSMDLCLLLEDYILAGYKDIDLVFFFDGHCSDLGVPSPLANLIDLQKQTIDGVTALKLPHAVLGNFFRVLQKKFVFNPDPLIPARKVSGHIAANLGRCSALGGNSGSNTSIGLSFFSYGPGPSLYQA
jgi:hypothetical protein